MISVTHEKDWIHFAGRGGQMLRFSACVRRSVRDECVRSSLGRISIRESAVSAVLECAKEFRVDMFEFSESIGAFKAHEQARQEAMKIIADNDFSGIPEEWDFLESHQKIAVNAMTRKGLLGVCLFDEQGTGKTLTALAAFHSLKESRQADAMIVVAPQSVINAWRDDAQKIGFANFSVSVVAGERDERDKALRERADIVLMGYDALVSMLPVAKAVAKRAPKCLLVADEAFLIKNPNAQRSNAVRELRGACSRAFVLSGTPAPRSAEDVIHQSDTADNGYAFQGYRPSGDAVADSAVIYDLLSTRGAFLRRTKSEVLPMLPPKEFNIVKVALSGEQLAAYQNARDNLVIYLQSVSNEVFKKELTSYFQRREKLLQFCGCPSMAMGGDNAPRNHAKLLELDKLIDTIVAVGGRKIVVWTSYTESIHELAARYQHHGLVKIYGGSSEQERAEAIRRFQKDSEVKIFLGNPAAAGAGITLHAAADSVYVSYTDRAAEFIQSIDRTHRIGQTAEAVRYHFLVCENTVEVNQIRLLKQKMVGQHLMFGEDAQWPSTVDDALEELEDE